MTHQLNLYDVETNTNYTLLLDAEDYNRALIDEAFASALLAHAKCTEGSTPPNITDENKNKMETQDTNGNEGEERATWTKDEILQLIHIYKENEDRYKSTTLRKEVFWAEVSSKMGTKTADQARNKFKYLKTMYLKKKDNMSSKATGQKQVQFAYFEEMDIIFGKQPNVSPVALASSSISPEKVLGSEQTETDEGVAVVNNKTKQNKNTIPERLNELKELLTKREENAERRHKENLDRKDKALEKLNEFLALASEKMEK